MHVILFGLGLLMTAIGAAMIGYGIPINEFSLGNTLILAGSVSVTGGLVLFGLAAAVRQLQRIGEALAGRPLPRPVRPAETAEPKLAGAAQAQPRPGRVPFPPRPGPGSAAEIPPVEPHLSGAPPLAAATGGNGGRSTPPVTPSFAEPPAVEEGEAVTLSPPIPTRAPPLAGAKPSDILAGARPRSEQPRPPNGGAAPMSESELPPAPVRAPNEPAAPNFDALWPISARQPKAAARTAERPPPAEPHAAPPAPSGTAAAPPAQNQVPILKSGVVDGMAYTLYADGSIEAQLPQGIMRFGSIAELRTHIEQNS
jgi:hypothetical protein